MGATTRAISAHGSDQVHETARSRCAPPKGDYMLRFQRVPLLGIVVLSAMAGAMGSGCGDGISDPVSSISSAPASRTVSASAVAGTCESPTCNSGFGKFERTFAATLGRAQRVPATPNAGGTTTLSLNADNTELTYEIRVVGVPNITNSHFHNAAAGANGGVVRALTGAFDGDVWISAGTWSSTDADQPLTAALVAELLADNLYINIHTADYGSGEIRGQVVLGTDGLTATLDRSQRVPSIPVSGGTGTFTLSADQTSLAYDIRVVGVPNVTAAHFHNAAAGSNGGVVRALSGTIIDDVWISVGEWRADEIGQPLTAALVQQLLSRRIYVNVHTADYGSGEVRGQVLP